MSDPPQPARRIDVHAHFLPPGYRQACIDAGHAMPDGFPQPPDWSTEAALELMDGVGVNVSLLSISSSPPSRTGESS